MRWGARGRLPIKSRKKKPRTILLGSKGTSRQWSRKLKNISGRSCRTQRIRFATRRQSIKRTAGLKPENAGSQTTSIGSSLKFCRLAAGQLDIYLRYGSTSEWDTAAGQVVLEEAGGTLTDLDGNRFRYNHRDSLINPDFLATAADHARWLSIANGAFE